MLKIDGESIEIRNPVFLCTNDGKLNPEAVGWSRFPLTTCNISGNYFRKKRWNYWCILNPEFLFSVTIADLDYASTAFAYYFDFENKIFQESSYVHPFGLLTTLGDTPSAPSACTSLGLDVHFTHGADYTYISVDWTNFHGKHLKARFHVIHEKAQESLNVTVPWSEHKFQYTSKQFGMPTEGEILLDKVRIHKFRNHDSFASLDYGRGNWPREIAWNWVQFVTRIGINRIGINIGGQWTDGTGITENAILFNNKIIKLSEPVTIEYDPKNFYTPWRVYTINSKTIDLYFAPIHVRKSGQNLFLISSEVNQGLGNFTGIIQVGGEVFYIPGAFGWAEEHKAVW